MQLNYQTSGEGPAVFLIHGLFGDLGNLKMLAKDLIPNYQVILVDVRNHGLSPHSNSMGYRDLAQDIIEIADQLSLTRYSLVGHSMGGKLAMSVAFNDKERVSKLVVADMAPVVYLHNKHDNVFNGLNAVNLAEISSRSDADKQLAEHIEEMGVRQFLLKSLYRSDKGFGWRFNINALYDQYQQIIGWPYTDQIFTGDTLFIKGQNSDYIKAADKAEFARQFPNASAKIIQGTGHWLHAEKPQIFNRLVSEFLAS